MSPSIRKALFEVVVPRMSPIGVRVAVGEADAFGSLTATLDAGCPHLHDITATRHAAANKHSLRFLIALGIRFFDYLTLTRL